MMGRVHVTQGKFRYYLDNLKLQVRYRWIATFILACFYALRAYGGYILLTYTLGMVLSTLVSFFLYTAIDPDDLDRPVVSSDALPPILSPIKVSDELRPFVPFLPEFDFWCGVNVVFCVALGITFIPFPSLPVPWYVCWIECLPLWLLYNIRILIEQREDMIKYKYIPFYYGNKKQGEYKGK